MSNLKTWKDKDQVTIKKEKTYTRFSFKTITSEILDFLMVNKGLFYTIKQLTIAPGATLRGYLQIDRERLTGAAKYFILIVGVFYFVFFQFTHSPYVEGYIEQLKAEGADEFAIYFQLYFLDRLSIWSALAIFLFAWLSRRFFKKHGLYYTEHVIVHTYINAQIAFYKLVMLPTVFFIGSIGYNVIETLVTLIYYVFVLHHFFREKFANTLWKSLLIIVFGYILFFIFMLFFWFILGFFLGLNR